MHAGSFRLVRLFHLRNISTATSLLLGGAPPGGALVLLGAQVQSHHRTPYFARINDAAPSHISFYYSEHRRNFAG